MTKERDPSWVRHAEEMFQEMKEKVSISQISYHVMMNIYCKSSDREGARKAEELLWSMAKERFSPSDISYNICIDAYARRGDPKRAEMLLEEMISLYDSGKKECRPTIHGFASVVSRGQKLDLHCAFLHFGPEFAACSLLSLDQCSSKIWQR